MEDAFDGEYAVEGPLIERKRAGIADGECQHLCADLAFSWGYSDIKPRQLWNKQRRLCAGSGGPRASGNQVRDVAIEVQYGFKPWISIVADFVPVFVIKTVSVVQTEY